MKHQETRSKRPGRKLQQQQLGIHTASGYPVVIRLSNGTRLRGIVVASDEYMVLLGAHARDANPQLIYKHAIAAVTQDVEDAPLEPDEFPTSPDFVPLFVPRTRTRRKREPQKKQGLSGIVALLGEGSVAQGGVAAVAAVAEEAEALLDTLQGTAAAV